jgi:nicotinamide mononucleotide adenylyltransferase
MASVKQGSVHGRFQPFHNGHLDYVLEAFNHTDFMWVGLTQIFMPRSDLVNDSSRERATSNPLSFLERSELVDAALVDAGIPRDRFRITPFPIESPERLREFIPPECLCFTTLVNEWNNEKVKRLNDNGFPTKILGLSVPDNMRVTSGTEIRRLIRANDPSWARFVPPRVAEIIDNRLRDSFFDVSSATERGR